LIGQLGWSPVESGRTGPKDKLLTDLALQPVLSQANGFGQSQLSVVEGPKSIRLQFESNGNVQAVERSNPKLGPVAPPQISAYLDRAFGHANLHPNTGGFILFQLMMQLIGLVGGQYSTKYVLSNSVCPLGAMKWRQP
jgi:hypothetical protein